jgi:hypothetical protein
MGIFSDLSTRLLRSIGLALRSISPVQLPTGVNRPPDNEGRTAAFQLQFQDTESARSSPALYNFVKGQILKTDPVYLSHPQEMMTKELVKGQPPIPIPVTVLTRASQITLITPPPPYDDDSDINAENDQYVQKMKSVNSIKSTNETGDIFLYNNKTFTMKDIAVSADGTQCTITGGISDYFSMLATHLAMDFELISTVKNTKIDSDLEEKLKKHLARRDSYNASSIHSRRKHAALAVSTLVVYLTSTGQYELMVAKRANDVAAYPSLFSVIPGGMLQPELSGPEDPFEKEWSIQHCVIKEYCEELFSAKIKKNAFDPFYIYYDSDPKWKPARELYDALKTGVCKILHSGVILNFSDMLPDICCVLLIEDPRWYETQRSQFSTNWEYMPLNELLNWSPKGRSKYNFEAVADQFLRGAVQIDDEVAARISGQWVPPGLATLWLGVEAVQEHLRGNRPAAAFESYLSDSEHRVPWRVQRLNDGIESVELSIRKLVERRLSGNRQLIPSNILFQADELIGRSTKKKAAHDQEHYRSLAGTLEYLDLRHLHDTIVSKSLWHLFEPIFLSKGVLSVKFDQLAELRNTIRHSRSLDEITEKEGEVAILWFQTLFKKLSAPDTMTEG